MGDHDGARAAGGAKRVGKGGDRLRTDGGARATIGAIDLGEEADRPGGGRRWLACEEQHGSERGQFGGDRLKPFELFERLDDQGGGARVCDHHRELAGRRTGRQRHTYRAREGDREVGKDRLSAEVGGDGDPVSRLDADLSQPGGIPVDAVVDLGIGERAPEAALVEAEGLGRCIHRCSGTPESIEVGPGHNRERSLHAAGVGQEKRPLQHCSMTQSASPPTSLTIMVP